MIGEASIAWLHFLGAFALAGAIGAELALYRREMTATAQRVLKSVDLGYGLSALVVLLTGLARVFWFGKGALYYSQNGFFWALIALFALISLLSLPPTLQYLRWQAKEPLVLDEERFRRLRTYLVLEAALFPLLPFCAVMMARGIG
jgi:putative membrane protein